MRRSTTNLPGRVAAVGGGAIGAAALAGGLAVGASSLIRARALAPVPDILPGARLRVAAVDGERLVFQSLAPGGQRDLRSSLVVGLEGRRGYGQLVGAPSVTESLTSRRYEHVAGQRPRPGSWVRLDLAAFQDAVQAAGVEAIPIEITTAVGPIRALHVPGRRDEWAVLVHGRIAGPLREPLRMLRPFCERGHPALIVSYRNASGAPRAHDRISRFGLDEWEDVDSAVAYALERGARSVVLGGISMGGAIAMSAAHRTANPGAIGGLVLDSPVLDLWAAIEAGAQRMVPGGPLARTAILSAAKPVTRRRYGLDWRSVDYVASADDLDTPTLLFHGSSDRIAPVSVSDQLAARRPDLVAYRRAPGVDHVRSWNADPAAYEAAISGFLEQIDPSTRPVARPLERG